ncbi:MAG: hypothetical protein HRF49_07710 [bacterium]|jgi:hypothetical protein
MPKRKLIPGVDIPTVNQMIAAGEAIRELADIYRYLTGRQETSPVDLLRDMLNVAAGVARGDEDSIAEIGKYERDLIRAVIGARPWYEVLLPGRAEQQAIESVFWYGACKRHYQLML